MTPEHVVAELTQAVCRVTFEKADGSLRTMIGTLDPSRLPPAKSVRNLEKPQPNPDVVRVWDLEIQQWRSFRVSRLTGLVRHEGVPL